MQQKILYWLKQFITTLAMLLIISSLMDFWRKPTEPLNASDTPFSTLQQPTPTTLAVLSQNQTLVLYFWGSWCGICRHTSPVIHDLQQDGIPVLGVALQSGSDEDIKHYLAQHGWQFDTLNDSQGQWSRQWDIKVTPSIVLIKNGKIIHSTTGLATYWGLKTRIALANLSIMSN